jgi:signal transduction histidine kinase
MVCHLLRRPRLGWIVLCWLVLVGRCVVAQPLPSERWVLSNALSAESAAGSFALLPETGVRTVPLPDAWAQSRPQARGPVWYRLAFEWPSAGAETPEQAAKLREPRALWIARACARAEVSINGVVLHRAAPLPHDRTALCNESLLLPVPWSLIKAGTNVVDIRLEAHAQEPTLQQHRQPGLSRVELGSSQALHTLAARHQRLHVGLPFALSFALALVGLYLCALGLSERRNHYLAYLGGLGVAVSVVMSTHWLLAAPVPAGTLDLFLGALAGFSAWMAVQFLLRHAGQRYAWVDRALPLQALLIPASLWLAGGDYGQVLMAAWVVLLAIQVAAAAGAQLIRRWAIRPRDAALMVTLLVTILVSEGFGLYASLSMMQEGSLLARAVTVTVLLLLMLRLTQQRARAQEVVEANRALLEQRVAEVKAEVENNYRQLAELRVVQVTERERKRIAADLHDDLGAKLLTIVHTSESERISTLAREALEEMRLSVRGLTGKPVRLEDALGDWRAEVISRLGQAGIEAVWNMPTEDLPQTLPARTFVQTTRIIREAVNNIIKHSGASQCAVRCNVVDGDFQLVLQDNGKGIAMELDGRLDRGHGLATMKGRAKQLQGQCLFESGPGYGTVVRLTIPLETSAQGS